MIALALGCASEPPEPPPPAALARLLDPEEAERVDRREGRIGHLRDALALDAPLSLSLPPRSARLRFWAAGEGALTVRGSEPELTVSLTEGARAAAGTTGGRASTPARWRSPRCWPSGVTRPRR